MITMNRPTEKVIAYSVYGTSKLYLQGALECLDFNEKYFADWHTEFYVAKNCPALPTLLKEESSDRCSVFIMPPSDHVEGSTVNSAQHHNEAHCSMLYRLKALFTPNRIVSTRDTDSRSSARELEAVDKWLKSDYPVCTMYDHPAHHTGILMVGLTSWDTRIISQLYKDYEDFCATEKRYREWYSTEGYRNGLRFCHYDIWLSKHLLIDKIGNDRILKIDKFDIPMPFDGSAGAHLGATVNEQEWRYQNWGT